VVVGDFDPGKVRTWIDQYFAPIPSATLPPPPDIAEPRQTEPRRTSRTDALANRPALGLAYHVPPRWTPEWFAFGLIDQILVQGRDSKLYDALVQRSGLTGDVSGGINWGLGNMFNYEGPMLWMLSLYHDREKSPDLLLDLIEAEMETLRTAPVDSATLARARTKMRSSFYSIVDEFSGLGKLDLLASFALFDSDPERFNRLEEEFAKVTPELIQRTAQEYLRPTNRTVYSVVAGAKDATIPGGK
jgi:predicted Zn-dependent peptidase